MDKFWEKLPDQLVELLKLSPRVLWIPLLIISGIALINPFQVLQLLSVADFAVQNRSWFGGIFLISLVFTAVAFLASGFDWSRGRLDTRQVEGEQRQAENRQLIAGKKRLQKLNEDEKDYLWHFVSQNKQIVNLGIADPVAVTLQQSDILSRVVDPQVPMIGSLLGGSPFRISDWAWNYLHDDPKLLEPSPPGRNRKIPDTRMGQGW